MVLSLTDHGKPRPSKNTRLNRLLSEAHKFLQSGLSTSTKVTYRAGSRRHTQFCKEARIKPIPTTECILTLFTTHLVTHIISLATIKVYFSAVRHMHLCRGLHDHFNQQITPRLQLILRDIKRRQACTNPIRQRLPVTTQMLCQIRQLLLKRAPSYFNTTLWAMCCLAFFGFLRVSEFTIPTEGSYTPLIIYHSKILLLIAGKNPAYSNCS